MLSAQVHEEVTKQKSGELIRETTIGKTWLGKIPLHSYEEEQQLKKRHIQKARSLIRSIDEFLGSFDDVDLYNARRDKEDQLDVSQVNDTTQDSSGVGSESRQERPVKDSSSSTKKETVSQPQTMKVEYSRVLLQIVSEIVRTAQEWLPFLPIDLVAMSALTATLRVADKIRAFQYNPALADFKSKLIFLRMYLVPPS